MADYSEITRTLVCDLPEQIWISVRDVDPGRLSIRQEYWDAAWYFFETGQPFGDAQAEEAQNKSSNNSNPLCNIRADQSSGGFLVKLRRKLGGQSWFYVVQSKSTFSPSHHEAMIAELLGQGSGSSSSSPSGGEIAGVTKARRRPTLAGRERIDAVVEKLKTVQLPVNIAAELTHYASMHSIDWVVHSDGDFLVVARPDVLKFATSESGPFDTAAVLKVNVKVRSPWLLHA